MPLDVLVFGPHPDDIEIGVGGTVARHAALGYRVGLCDLTVGELGSNGTPEERLAEAEAARRMLGAEWRENLRLPDGRLVESPEQIRAVTDVIRRTQPRVVLGPADYDRHPDHFAASRLITRAVFMAGLRRYATDADPWRPDWLCYYFINDMGTPSFLIDVSEYYDVKRRALGCHRTQFAPSAPDRVATRLTSSRFQQLIESRDAQFGATIGVTFAEGLIVKEPIVRNTVFKEDQATGRRA